jgi:hypothetical protein
MKLQGESQFKMSIKEHVKYFEKSQRGSPLSQGA